MDKGTILYIGGFELPDKNAAAQRVIANGKIMKNLGYEVIYVGVSKSKNNESNQEHIYEGFSYYLNNYPSTLFGWIAFLSSIKNVKRFKDINISHIVAYNYPSIALYRLNKYCRRKKIKLLADCTEWYEPQGKFLFKIIKGLDVYFRMRILHPKLDGLIVISDFLEKYYKSKNVTTVNIPPLVDLTMKKWNFNSKLYSDQLLKLVYAGSPGTGKKDRLDKVISFLSIIKVEQRINLEFSIIGLTEEEYFIAFGHKIPENIADNIIFRGRISHIEVLEAVHASHFQIFLRDNNLTNKAGFPTKFVEAISCGTPVLTNNSSSIIHYLSAGKTGFLLDDASEERMIDSLIRSLTLKMSEIIEMKHYCESSKMFDYQNYINSVQCFFNKLKS